MSEAKIYNIGIIGAGMIARVHMASLQKTGRAKIIWIAARNPENLEKVRLEFNIPNKTRDYQDIMKDPAVDVVLITTPPDLHRQMFMEAMKAGKHVLLEKPMAMSLNEIDEMLALKAKHPEQLAMECSGRHSRLIPKFKKVKEIIDSGALGHIYSIHHNCVGRQGRPGIEYHPTAKWFLNKAIAGGGPLFDWGVYDLSFHLGILGDQNELERIESVKLMRGLDEADPGTDVYDVEEHFIVSMELSGGISYFWERAAHANMETANETRIYGTRGGIKLGFNSWDDPNLIFYDLDEKGKARSQKIELDYTEQDDAYALSEHLIRVLDGEEDPVISMELARKHMDIIFRCYEEAEG
ncbi:MAG: Gfo/Idh/MocA family oxidoreductase [Bacteroides sp.]|nr:Gfo/Idh/MocA family oxidoreductase [Bacteroides sp.]